MQLRSVLGQVEIKNYLTDAISKDRLPHALLFLGQSGYGTLPMALATAQFLMCEQREAKDSCGTCPSCHKSSRWIHPDIHFTFPTIGSKMTSLDFLKPWRSFLELTPYGNAKDWLGHIGGENKQGNITKDECNRILKALSLKTFEGRYKVHILWLPEYLGAQGNRLLKIIEEPPENTIFLLVAVQQQDILNTIVSRCQVVSFAPLSDDELTGYLQENHRLDSARAEELAYMASGSLGEALSVLAADDQATASGWIQWMRICYKGNAVEMISWVDQFAKKDREAQKNFFFFGLHFLREMVVSSLDPAHMIRLLDVQRGSMTKLSSLVTLADIRAMIDLAEESIGHLERNASTKIMMLDNSIQLSHIFRAGRQTSKPAKALHK